MTATLHIAQLFCTVADLVADMQTPGANEAGLLQRIREASDFLQKEIGHFIPVTRTRRFHGRGQLQLLVPPLLSISSIINDEITLVASDYLLHPDARFWPHGPYGALVVDPDHAANLSAWDDEVDGVEIAGTWGLYDRTVATGALVKDTTQQSDSQGTLTIDDGSKVSPGMVLLIGDEQELVSGWSAPVDSTADLDEAMTATDPVLTATDASLVAIGEILRLDFEQMKVLDKNETTQKVLVARGWNQTQAVLHADATSIEVYRTVTVERGVNGTTAAEHLTDAVIARYVVPDDVLFLTKEIATLMLNKAKSGYQGRTGNDQGVTFYNDAFPARDIETIKKAYRLPRMG